MQTLLLNRLEVRELLDPAVALPELSRAFQAYSCQHAIAAQRARSELPGPGTATVLFPGIGAGVPAYSVKVHAKYPDQSPAIRGVLLLHDSQTGDLLAIMDSTYLTAVRTGLVSALATDLLAKKDASSVAIVGAGVQGEFQLRFLSQLRQLKRVLVTDTIPGKATGFAKRMASELNITVLASPSLESAVSEADIILTATWSREPFLFPEMVKEGVHISTLGPDEPGKCEVDASLIERSTFVCDDRELAASQGAIGGAGLDVGAIDAELGEIIAGDHPGRADPKQITIFGSVGIAFQDVIVAWQVYKAARKKGIGRSFEFFNETDILPDEAIDLTKETPLPSQNR